MAIKPIFMHCLSPMHAGSGQGFDVIDLPIVRERSTELPYFPGSSIKGCLRDASVGFTSEQKEAVFGPDTGNAAAHAGGLQIPDARLLLFPVRSITSTFLWATSPFLLARFRRDSGLQLPDCEIPVADSVQLADCNSIANGKVYLEEFQLSAKVTPTATKWATSLGKMLFARDAFWLGEFNKRFAIVDDDTLFHLAKFATEVVTQIQINDDTGTVKKGMLWLLESLPAETVLVTLLNWDKSHKHGVVMDYAQVFQKLPLGKPLQMGGKATTGKGIVRLVGA